MPYFFVLVRRIYAKLLVISSPQRADDESPAMAVSVAVTVKEETRGNEVCG